MGSIKSFFFIGAIIVLGFTLRVIGVHFGFPFLVHPDEPTISYNAFQMITRNSFDPNTFNRPDHIMVYINAITYQIASYLWFHKSASLTYESNIQFFYVLGRLITAILGTITLYFAYLIGQEYNKRAGMIIALLFAIFPLFVKNSHFITPDIPLVLFVMVVMFFSIEYLKNSSKFNLFMMCLFTVLAIGEKYPGIILTILVLSVVWMKMKDKKKLVHVIVFICILQLIITPFLFLRYDAVISALKVENRQTHPGADGLSFLGNMWFYAQTYYSGTGIILLVFLIIGVYYILKVHKNISVPIFFGFIYWIILSVSYLHWDRWGLPMFVTPLILSGIGISIIWDNIHINSQKYIIGIVILFAIGSMFLASVTSSVIFTLKDTRVAAYDYTITTNITPQNSMYEGYTPFLPSGPPITVGNYSAEYIIASSNKYSTQTNYTLIKEYVPITDLKQYISNTNSYQGPNIRIYGKSVR